jgi:hypothetical protein
LEWNLPVTTARQVLATSVPKPPERPLRDEYGYQIDLSEPDSRAVREMVLHDGSTPDGEVSS